MQNIISATKLSARYGSQLIIDSISFDISDGEIVAIIGPSGCGKSTLLNIIGGIKKHYEGTFLFKNEEVRKLNFSCGYVPQNLGLLAWKTVSENIFIAKTINSKLDISENEATEIIEGLGLTQLLGRYPAELSGGQKQRVALARIFVSCPDVLLLDEPFSALDTFTSESTRKLFLELWKKRKITSLITTHNILEAVSLGRKIMIMSRLPAKVLHIVNNPLFEKGAERTPEKFHEFSLKIQAILENEKDKGNF